MNVKKCLVAIVLAVTLLSGCGLLAEVIPWIAQITAIVVDAANVLNIINDTANKYFTENNTPVRVRNEFNAIMVKARVSLQAANSALRGADNLTQEKFDLAFSNFNEAYKELVALCDSIWVTEKGLRAYDVSRLPVPLSLTYKVEWEKL